MASRSGISRRKRVKPEDEIIREILKLQKMLKKEHNSASIFSYYSKFGIIQFGTDNLVAKFQQESDDWKPAFELDQDNLIQGDEMEESNDGDELNETRAALLPIKLPALVSLMSHEELWKWITQETLKEHWRKGGQSKHVKFGNPEHEPAFWLGDIWEWVNVEKNPKNLNKASYTGPRNMTKFLKKFVKNNLALLGINPDQWVSSQFTDEEKFKRERTRKKSTPSCVEVGFGVDFMYMQMTYIICTNIYTYSC